MKKIFFIITIGLFCVSAFSQQQNRHEFSIWAGGPISTLNFDAPNAEQDLRFGFQAGIGYNYFLNYNWSLGLGAEVSMLSGKLKYNSIAGSYLAHDNTPDQELVKLDYSTGYYEEVQNAMYVNIPLQLKFQTDAFKSHKFYFAVGPKVGIPVSATYKQSGKFTTSFQYEWSDPLVAGGTSLGDRGVGTYNNSNKEGDLDLRLNFIASAEAGIKWRLNEKLNLYTGVYIDYGLNDIRTSDDKKRDYELFQINPSYNTVRNYTNNSFLQSQNGGSDFVDKVNTMSFGVKAALAFGKSPFSKKVQEAPAAPVEKPFEGLTAAQMEDIMARSTKEMMEFQRKEFDALKELISQEDPALTQAIINFDLDKKEILPRMISELEQKVTLMKKYPKAKLMIEGHTDDLGSDKYNYELGLDRANAVKNYLVKKGIDANRLQVSSKGKTQPIVSNSSNENRFYNRRVEFILIQ